jgi:hypothetical protein
MISLRPKPLKDCHPPQLKERPIRMTMIGAINCPDGVIMVADGQETITDYAKWNVEKMKFAEFNNTTRIVMTGAGLGDTIDMIWEKVSDLWGAKGHTVFQGFRTGIPVATAKEWRDSILTIVREIIKEAIIPAGDSEVELIWFVQDLAPESLKVGGPPELFKTRGMNENNILRYHFGGNPIQLLKFLSDFYLKSNLYLMAEAQALACYLLWEAKQYDPTVGKQSDIVAFGRDGSTHHMTRDELNYWEEHFAILKREMSYVPILSCATGTGRELHDFGQQIGRLNVSIKTLIVEQEKMRSGKRSVSKSLDKIVGSKIRAQADQYHRKKTKKHDPKPSDSETSEGQQ